MSTLASRKLSTIGPRTKAAGARAVQNLGSSLALKVIAMSLHGFIVATWQTLARPRSARLRLLFEANVSKTVNIVFLSVGRCSEAFWVRRSSLLLATCRSTQHALRLCVDMVSTVLWILQGPLSHPSNTVPRPVVGFCFFVIGSGDLRECTLLVRTGGFVRVGAPQNFVWVFQALSMA